MDDALALAEFRAMSDALSVLILVVMDDALAQYKVSLSKAL